MIIALKKLPQELKNHIRKFQKQGYPIFCATCKKLPQGLDNGAKHCSAIETCGGPLKGKAFPDYDGFIPRDKFALCCLKCGDSGVAVHILIDGEKAFGLCGAHMKIFDSMSEAGPNGLVVKTETGHILLAPISV